ncbi:hypothetical protein ACFL4R_00930 [Nitrospirota bacterium]
MRKTSSLSLALTLFLFTLSPGPAHPMQQGDQLKASGYLRSFATYSINPLTDSETAILETRIRLKLSGDLSSRISAELAYELAPIWKENAPAPPGQQIYQGFSYRAGDLKQTLYPDDPHPGETFMVNQNLDRAFVSYSGMSFDLHAGRQPIAFGSARSLNPTDVLAPYPLNTIAKEERIGVDALRLRVPLGQMSELDAGAVFGDDARTEESAAYLRLKGYALGTDVSVMAMRFRKHSLYGLDLTRSIGGAGAWLETAHVFTNTTGDDYFSLSTGVEYMFTDEFYAYIEYHRNGAGAGDKSEYPLNLLKVAYTEGGVYLMSMDYLAPGISYQASPLVGLGLSVIYNLEDSSALISPTLEYNASENVYIGLGGFVGTGDSGILPGQGSEFGDYPDLLYASLSYYF